MKKIWMFSGCQGSGKTTYANELEKVFGFRSKRLKFADVLYQLHDACLPILQMVGARPHSMTKDGELLQILGSEFGRNKIGPDVWVDALKKNIDRHMFNNPDSIVIVDDCRFENEFDKFFMDAHMVRLTCPEEIRKKRCSYWREDTNHISETGLDAYEAAGKFHARIETSLGDPKDHLNILLKQWGYLDV